MSHASLLVAIDVIDPENRDEVEAAVQFQMEPYDERGKWFRDGSRWDWYKIGGRFTGLLSNYEPREDPQNWSTCTICAGSGVRPGGIEQFGPEWFTGCHGCNGCNGTGKSLNWNFVPFTGDVIQVKDLANPVTIPHAFLRSRHWHEGERLGFFGGTAATECEIKADGDLDVLARRCITIGDENACVVTWMEPSEIWKKEFHHRFIEPLGPETVLVVVDYHV